MTRRLCQSCAYFKPKSNEKFGWCEHPQLASETGLKLMVRPNEIRCRNDWEKDLWVPRGSQVESNASDAEDVTSGSDEITSIVPFRMESPETPDDNTGEDLVVDVTPSHIQPNAPKKSARDLIQNPAEALRRAHELHLEKMRRNGRLADTHSGTPILADTSDDDRGYRAQNVAVEFESSTRSVNPVLDDHVVPPVTREEFSRQFPTITSTPADDSRFESVPQFDEVSALEKIVFREAGPTFPEPMEPETVIREQDYFFDTYDDEFDDIDASSGMVDQSDLPSRRVPTINRWLHGFFGKRQNDFEPPVDVYEDSDEPDLLVHQEARVPESKKMHRADEDWQHPIPPSVRSVAPAPDRQEAAPLDDHVAFAAEFAADRYLHDHEVTNDQPDHDETAFETLAAEFAADRHLNDQEVTNDQPDHDGTAFEMLADDLPEWNSKRQIRHRAAPQQDGDVSSLSVAPDLPRICRTCRDFRPAGTGERGWCDNKRAFGHRRMVDADELACGSSSWCWWLPHDGIWQKDFDTSRYAAPTPRVDKLLAATHRYGKGESDEFLVQQDGSA